MCFVHFIAFRLLHYLTVHASKAQHADYNQSPAIDSIAFYTEYETFNLYRGICVCVRCMCISARTIAFQICSMIYSQREPAVSIFSIEKISSFWDEKTEFEKCFVFFTYEIKLQHHIFNFSMRQYANERPIGISGNPLIFVVIISYKLAHAPLLYYIVACPNHT